MSTFDEAKASLLRLVEHVAAYQGKPVPSITYQELALRIGRLDKNGKSNGHGMGSIVLKKMGNMLRGLEVGWGERIPHIQCLVGEKGDLKHLPDEGIREFWPNYCELSTIEKEVRVNLEKQRISDYGSKWSNVLTYFKIEDRAQLNFPKRPFGEGGESPEHKALKHYVSDNPSLCGVNASAKVFNEYPLPSLDVIDVLFKETDQWTAVEVKSCVSDGVIGDFERGLYQTVKYCAILNAMRSDKRYDVPADVKVYLVLETVLPESLKKVAASLPVRILENVVPGRG